MKNLIFSFFFISFLFSPFSFSQKIDSLALLERKLPNLENEKELLKVYEKLLNGYIYEDESKFLHYLNELKEKNTNKACPNCEMLALSFEGNWYDLKGDIPSAIKTFEKLNVLATKHNERKYIIRSTIEKVQLMILEEHNLDKAEILLDYLVKKYENNQWEINLSIVYGLYANIHTIRGNLYLTKDYFEKAEEFLNTNKKYDKAYTRASIYSNISYIFTKLKDYKKADEYIDKALTVLEGSGDEYGMYATLLFRSDIDFQKKNYQKALNQALECFDYFNKINDSYYLFLNSLLLARIYKEQKKYKEAESYIIIAEKHIMARNAEIEIANTLALKTEILTYLGKTDQAKIEMEKAEAYLNHFPLSEVNVDVLNAKIKYFKATNQPQSVYSLYLERDSIQNIVNQNANQKLVHELEIKFQTEKKEQQIKLLSAENELNEERRKNQLLIFGVLAALMLIGGFSIFYSYRNKIKTAEKIKELNEMKSRFFANISHEFRTPLTLIKSPLQNLQKNISDGSGKKDLNLIEQNSNRILELIDQLLELSKIDSGKLSLILKEGNLKLFINSIVEPFVYKANLENLNFESKNNLEEALYVYDKDVLQKIISNLLSNAIKYTPEGEKIRFVSEVQNDTLKLIVSNSGSTVKESEFTKLFERFHQQSSENEGFGIGLALVKDLVNVYKGKITAKKEGNVLSFHIELPLHKTATDSIFIDSKDQFDEMDAEIENSTIEVSDEKPILLIVDDNKDIRNLIKSILNEQFDVMDAADAESALEISKNTIPDCIISDVMMPGMNGFEFTQQIKTNELTSFIPVILLTAKTSDEDRLESLKSEADKFITKPFTNDILVESVHQLLKERKSLRERYSKELILKPVEIAINTYDEKFLDKIYHVFEKNFNDPDFSVDQFSAQMGLSRMQLHRKLKSLLNVSTTEFIRNERVKTAAEMMKKGHKNISEIAYTVGFNNLSYFNKCFKQVFDVTPTEFISKV